MAGLAHGAQPRATRPLPPGWEGNFWGSNLDSLGVISLCEEGLEELSEKAAAP